MTWNRPRPARVARPAVVLTALAGAFFVIARTTGSGWVTVLLCGVVGCLVTAWVWPLVVVSRAAVALTGPRDGTAGQPLVLAVSAVSGAGLLARTVEPPSDWFRVEAPGTVEALATPTARGVLDAVAVEMRSATPLGLFWWRRVAQVPLAVPLEVGPRRLDVSIEDLAAAGAVGAVDVLRGRTGHDTVRSVRPYVPGDPVRLVHWPATARWGDLMVRELEDPEVPGLAIVVDLHRGGGRAETAASHAAGLAEAALSRGVPVWLLTAERGRHVIAEVTSPLEVGRRLARAGPAPPPEGPVAAGAVIVLVDQ